MEKDEVLKALKKEGRFEEYDDLYNDNVSLSDWVSRNEDLIRSNRNIAKAVGVDTPKGGVNDSYFKGQNIDKEKYERSEKKLSEAQAEKQKLADEYQRAKDIEEHSKFGWEWPTSDMSLKDRMNLAAKNLEKNVLALGLKLTPQAAKNVYIKEGYKPGKLALQGGLGTSSNVAEILPGPGKAGKAITTFGGPAIRAGQDLYEGKPISEVGRNFAHDAGLNTLFEYMPVKEAYNYAKRILGRQGGAGEKAVASKVEKELDKIDALENAKEAHDVRRKMYTKIDDFERQYNKGILNDTDLLDFAEEIQGKYPELAKRLREHVNLLAKNRNAAAHKVAATDPTSQAMQEAKETVTAKHIPESNEKLLAELSETKKNAEDNFMLDDAMVDKNGNLIAPLPDDNIAEVWRVSNPSEFAKKAVKALPYARAAAKSYTGPDRESMAPKDKDYNNALEYIISNYSRQWDAGFKPKGGIELEAWKKYKGIE
jgi:hypothetical protein